jgi:signal transduction histidine kinase/ActR/RegA family two-component response regulator/CHASE3 domain sensor protein
VKSQSNLSVTDRVIIGFSLILVMLGVVVGVTRYLFDRSAAAQHELTASILPRSEAAQELEETVLYLGVGVRGYLLTRSEQVLAQYRQHVRVAHEWMRRIESGTDVMDRDSLLVRIAERVDGYIALTDSLVTRSLAFDPEVELALRERREDALLPLRQYAQVQRAETRAAMAALSQNRARVELALLIAFIAGSVFAVGVAIMTVLSIRRPTRQLLDVATAMQGGDWVPATRFASDDAFSPGMVRSTRNELVQIGRAFGAAALALSARERQLRTSNRVSMATAASLKGDEIASAVLGATCEHVGAEVGAVYMRAAGSDRFDPVATRALDGDLPSLRVGEGIPGEAAASGRMVVVSNLPADSPFRVRLGLDELPPRALAAIPCLFGEEVVGVLLVASLRNFPAADLAFLEATATQLAIGIQNVHTHDTVQRLLTRVSAQREQITEQFSKLQAQHEELQAQHEEIQSQNEEIQAQSEEIQAQSEEIQAQNTELHSQTAALRQADDHKNDFLGLLAHELRNPMASISNSLVLLEQSRNDPSIATRAQAIIERQTRQLTRLVDDLLDITRISRGKVQIERAPLDFVSVIRDCVDDHAAVAGNAGVTVDCVLPEEPLIVDGDHARLLQVVGNLLDNAIKFSHPGGTIRLWAAADHEQRQAVLTISDDGIGIDADIQSRLFQPFIQADPSRTRSRGGLGLGLSLVRAYVLQHDGRIRVRSDGPGSGSEFTISLPLAQEGHLRNGSGSVDATPASAEEAGPPRRVLLVEDDTDGASSLQQVLALDGHEVCVAETVELALQLARTFAPDIVICDVGLPVVDGYEFARRARRHPTLSGTFLIALTGYAAPQDKQRAVDAGFDRHLTKPASLGVIRSLFANARVSSSVDA